jgi:hypothetical protein
MTKKFFPTLGDSVVARPRLNTKATAGLDRNQVLTRYLADRKFIDSVGTSSLYFARLRLLLKNDPDEGRIATSAYLDASAMVDPPNGMPRDQNAYLEFLKVGPHEQAYISCWYMGGPDSDRMWGEYVPDGEGVAASTTVGQLLDCFDGDDGIKVASLAPIRYIKPDADMPALMDRDNFVAALQYKGDNFKHENEMRAIILYNTYYISGVLPIFGERLPIVNDAFINSIRIAPNATNKYQTHVRNVLENTPLEKRIG